MNTPPLVYCAGPFSGPTRADVELNIAVAVRWGIEVAKLGAFPVIPHANTSHPEFESVQPYPFWIAGTLALLRGCQAVFMVPGWEKSSGARGERLDALKRGVPVFDEVGALKLWLETTWLETESAHV